MKSYEKNLVEGIKGGNLNVTDTGLYKGKDFEDIRLAKLAKFNRNFFMQRLSGFP